jgi:hypothetical protein
MNNSSELRHLADSIAGLVTTITEIINTKVQTATNGAVQAHLPTPPTPPPLPTTVQVATCDPWLTKRLLAAHSHVSVRTIDTWLAKGYLSHYKIGRMVRFRLNDIQNEWDTKLKRQAFRTR